MVYLCCNDAENVEVTAKQNVPLLIYDFFQSTLKGYSTPKLKFCQHLLTLKLLQTCMSFFLLLNTKEAILKNDWNQTVV